MRPRIIRRSQRPIGMSVQQIEPINRTQLPGATNNVPQELPTGLVTYPLSVADGVKGGSSVVDPLSLDIVGLATGTLATTTELAINNGTVNEKTTLSDLATFLDGRDVYSVADITALNAITGMDTGDVAIVADTFDLTGEHVAGSYVYDGTNWLLESRYAVTLNNLLDVNAPSPVAGDILQWNGTQWVNNSSGGGGSSYIPPYLKTGGASWSGTGLVYDVTTLEYYFNGDKLAAATQVTLDASDPVNNRLDAIVVDEAGVVSVIKGDASASPISPSVDESHILIQYILVEAGSTQPTIAKEDIYLENVEWTTSTYTTGTATGSIDFDNAVSPKQGVKCISANADARLGARFVRTTSFDPYQYTMLSMWVRFTGSNVATNKSLNVRFENGAGALVANTINLFNFGLQRNLLNVWQLVVIPITSFGTLPTSVKGLKIIMTGGTVGQARQWDIDLISLTDNSVPSINEQAFNVLKDGALVGQSSTINFKGAPVTVTNDPINKKIDVEVTGGGSPAGSNNQIQINQSGSFFADSTFQKSDTGFNLGLDHTTQSAVTFTGSGLDDLNLYQNNFTGTYPTTYTVTIDGINKDVLLVNTSSISGGSFTVGNTITNGLGASATIDAISVDSLDDKTIFVISSYTGTFNNGDTIDNGSGVTATQTGSVTTRDTFTWTDGTTTVTQKTVLDSNGVYAFLSSPTGHTLTDSWTWTYSNVNQNVLDFSNNDYNFKSTFGTDTFGYQISDNLFGVGISGSVNTWTNVAGDLGITGIFNNQQPQIIDQIVFADGFGTTQSLLKNQYNAEVSNGTESSAIGMTSTTFGVSSFISSPVSGEYGISQSAGVVSLGSLIAGNGTKITIDDVTKTNTINGGIVKSAIQQVDYGTDVLIDKGVSSVMVGATGTGTSTVNLDPTCAIGQEYSIFDVGYGGNSIVIDADTGNTILAAAASPSQTFVMNQFYESVIIKKISSTQWMIIAKNN